MKAASEGGFYISITINLKLPLKKLDVSKIFKDSLLQVSKNSVKRFNKAQTMGARFSSFYNSWRALHTFYCKASNADIKFNYKAIYSNFLTS
jgi:hypothetical protein